MRIARRELLALLAGMACAPARRREVERPARVLRSGPERTRIAYDDPRANDKHVLFERINRDRTLHGVAPVEYDPRAALVGDLFCLDGALSGSWGHWDLQGRAPYVRWGLSGGVDFHAENAAAWNADSGRLDTPVGEILIRSHESMMAETPPADGHRRTILDPQWTHVGVGIGAVGGQFRMTQEFTRVGFEWIEIPAEPVRAGAVVTFAGKPLLGWEVGLIEVRFEPPPRQLTRSEIAQRGSYGYPPVIATERPPAPSPFGVVDERGPIEHHRGGWLSLPVPPGPRARLLLRPLLPAARGGRGGADDARLGRHDHRRRVLTGVQAVDRAGGGRFP
jgi:uncharacterized protein YkwD